MTELERRALLGDRKAQEECTRQGIALPCPFCGSEKVVLSNWGMWRCWCSECLGKSEDELRQHDAIKHWNARTAPPVGRCVECGNACDVGDDLLRCDIFDRDMMPDDFCSQFEPKGGEENA